MNVMQLYTSKLETKLRAIQLVSTHINLYTHTHTHTHTHQDYRHLCTRFWISKTIFNVNHKVVKD